MDGPPTDAIAGTRTTCPYCGVGCGVVAKPDGTIIGDRTHPANFGRLCSKGAALADTLRDDERLRHPEIAGRRASWDKALDTIASRLRDTIDGHGPDAVALYVSGQFLTEDYYVANKLMKGFIGSANIDTNSRLCMASSVAGHVRAFGEDIVPGCYDDIDRCDLAILIGSNMAWCHPVLYQRLIAAKKSRGTRIVVIDPRRTASCDSADLHLALRPETDVALFAGLLAAIARRGAADEAWIARNGTGFAAALAAATEAAPSVAAVAAITGLAKDDLQTFYDWFIATERAVTLYSQGVNQSARGTDKVNAILNCHLATGRIGKPGMGPFSLTGQPNAMGGREVGGFANQLAAHIGFGSPQDHDRVRRFWRAPALATAPGLKAVDLFEAVDDGRIKAIWIMGSNPAASMPRANRVSAALAACPFVVVSDCWPTDTTRLADIVLPTAGWSEKDGTVTNSERRISRQRAFREPPGEARADWWMLAEVAKRLGFGLAFDYRDPAAIFREHAALSAFENHGQRLFDIGALAAISGQEYERLDPVQWPLAGYGGTARLFGDGAFATADGKARFVPTSWRSAGPGTAAHPFLLNTGRIRDQWHTMTRTGRVPRLMTHTPEPTLDMHPEDASALGLTDGDLAQIVSDEGDTVMRLRLSRDVRRCELFVPMHWGRETSSAGPVDRLIGAAIDPISGQPALKSTPVKVTPLTLRWHGFLLSRRPLRLADTDFYWSRIPLEGGTAYELAGWSDPPEGPQSESWVRALLGAPDGTELMIFADPRRGVFRYASLVGGRLDACLFLAGPAAALPPRDALIVLLGSAVDDVARPSLLSGGGSAASARDRTGPVLCTCFQVGLKTLQGAIRDGGLASVEAIGAALGAGTNCGSCIPELKRVLADTPRQDA
jgi:assimilatory nitrate reductase catalytic subunit